MRTGFFVIALVAGAGVAFWVGRATAGKGRAGSSTSTNANTNASTSTSTSTNTNTNTNTNANTNTSTEPGSPLSVCVEALARAKAPVAKDAGLSDTQARALLAMLAPHDRAKLEEVVRAEANGQLATHADVERRTVAAVLEAAFASAEVTALQADEVRRKVCALRGATAQAARQLARGELVAADYVALVSATRAQTEATLGQALGGPRFDKLRAAGALDGPACE